MRFAHDQALCACMVVKNKDNNHACAKRMIKRSALAWLKKQKREVSLQGRIPSTIMVVFDNNHAQCACMRFVSPFSLYPFACMQAREYPSKNTPKRYGIRFFSYPLGFSYSLSFFQEPRDCPWIVEKKRFLQTHFVLRRYEIQRRDTYRRITGIEPIFPESQSGTLTI